MKLINFQLLTLFHKYPKAEILSKNEIYSKQIFDLNKFLEM